MRRIAGGVFILLFIFGLSCRGPEGPAGPPGSSGLETLTDPNVQPKVIHTIPAANSVGPYPQRVYSILLRFNKVMDLLSLRRAIRFRSEGDGVRLDSNNITSSTGDIVLVYPNDEWGYPIRWKIGSKYFLDIVDGARDINGNTLPAYSMSMTPEPSFRVVSVWPTEDIDGASTMDEVFVMFNSKVDSAVFSHITLEPRPIGRWVVTFDSIFAKFEHLGLSFKTRYQVKIDGGAHDKDGNVISRPGEFSFATSGFRVVQTYPESDLQNRPLAEHISLYFSGELDVTSVQSAISITPYSMLSILSGPTSVGISNLDNFNPSTRYTIIANTQLRGKDGTPLDSAFTFTFTTGEFQVDYTYPDDGRLRVQPYEDIQVYFNAILDTGSIRSAFSIEPAVEGVFEYTYGTRGFQFNPSRFLRAGSVYTVQISQSIRAIGGFTLSAPYSFSFRISND